MKKLLGIILAILLVTGCASGVQFKKQTKEDRIQFKEDYEKVNAELDADGDPLYKHLTIGEANNFVYLTYDEVLDFITNGTGILYLGRPECPWCRVLVPIMQDFAKEEKIYIYYYDIEADRNENNERYHKIIELMGDYLPIDTVTQKETDKNFNPKLKRVVLPQLFFMKGGKVKEDLMAYQHECLEKNQKDEMKALLKQKLDFIK